MKTFDIRISDTHREYLLTALSNMISLRYLGADAADREEIDLLKGMLDDLTDPSHEPDCVHDFTL